MHVPVLLRETLDWLAIRPDGVYLDCTCGLGGHTGEIARRLTTGVVIANDWDADSLEKARGNTADVSPRIHFHRGPFSSLPSALASAGVERVDGLLADLGVSRYQLTDAERGFSMMTDGPLDMRMDRSQTQTAADIVNFSSEKDIADLIYRFGEERRSRRIAASIIRARPIQSTLHLAKVIERVAPRTGRIHPATQTFMALRLAVNGELDELDTLLSLAPRIAAPGGRVLIISFMSLEDRRVKQSFQALARSGRAALLTRHVVTPSDEEIRRNPASRSAKLRVLEMKQADVELSGRG
jgi:16S rRNA (cytosine1402-N4)-methyltransferase